ncbi:hypothetical protein CC86DRAFT_468265 [Ophiobolus disseminans]|uniref:Rhodopsin domain-containing protein n=1 Tax=Ophiobolus disseminans TaxID=1469910 RepID=A0A6A6ZWB2_9PLEO|nr:hypothetical protein CC86DRAFT_468265 [Ophiobolus disseminans]
MAINAEPVDPQWAAQNNLPRILALTGIVHLLALSSVGLRLYVRIHLLRTPGKDDAVIGMASLAGLGGWICFIVQGYHGLGRHTKIISSGDLIAFDRIGFFMSLLSALTALSLLKISIALFLLRLSKSKWYSRSLWALIGLICVYSVGALLTFLLRCSPVPRYWDKGINGTCYSNKIFVAVSLTNSYLNVFTDVCFATLPIPIVWSLKMSQRTRMYLIGVLSLGYVAVAMGAIKTVHQVRYIKEKDRHFNSFIQFWGFMQLNVGIIAASIPTLRGLLRNTTIVSTGNRYNQFDDSQQPAILTIGSGRRISKPQKTFPNAVYLNDDGESHEMSKRSAKNTYHVDVGRTGSEDNILESSNDDANRIRCTTKVTVDSVEKGRSTLSSRTSAQEP